jgi:uridine kinase
VKAADGAPQGAPQGTALLAVDGVDGSGKSVFAERLVVALGAAGIATALLRVDDFRQSVDWLRPGRSEAEAYHDDYYELAAVDQVARAFLAGASQATIPTFDSALGRRTGAGRLVQMGGRSAYGAPRLEGREGTVADDLGARAIVVEGVFALRVAGVRAGAAVIYLQTSLGEARRRILARDTARGRRSEDVLHRVTERYFPAQERYIREQDPVGRADVLIEHERLGQPAVARFDATRLPPSVAAAIREAVAAFAGSPTVK